MGKSIAERLSHVEDELGEIKGELTAIRESLHYEQPQSINSGIQCIANKLGEMSRHSDLAISFAFLFGSITVMGVGFTTSSQPLGWLGVGFLAITSISFVRPFWRTRIGRKAE